MYQPLSRALQDTDCHHVSSGGLPTSTQLCPWPSPHPVTRVPESPRLDAASQTDACCSAATVACRLRIFSASTRGGSRASSSASSEPVSLLRCAAATVLDTAAGACSDWPPLGSTSTAVRAAGGETKRDKLERLFASDAEEVPTDENLSEFERFLENRRKGGTDADFYASREAKKDDSEDDWMSEIKYKPPK